MVDRGPRCGRAARILETGEAQVAHVLTTICARVAMSAHCSSRTWRRCASLYSLAERSSARPALDGDVETP